MVVCTGSTFERSVCFWLLVVGCMTSVVIQVFRCVRLYVLVGAAAKLSWRGSIAGLCCSRSLASSRVGVWRLQSVSCMVFGSLSPAMLATLSRTTAGAPRRQTACSVIQH